MSNNAPAPKLLSLPEKIQALQYLFDLARQAPASAAIHEQARIYATSLADSFSPPAPEPAEDPRHKIEQAVAAAVAKAKAAEGTSSPSPEAAVAAETKPFVDQGEPGPGTP